MNFSESALKLMGDFLNQRTQKVKVNGKQSVWIELARGAPQGTVLGPLMFNLFVNDLNDSIDSKSQLIQYADDCLIFSTGTESSKTLVDLQKNNANIENYFSTHQLNSNASKTEFITFSRKNDKHCTESQTVTIGKTHVNKVNACKYLGVTTDEHLSFNPQVKKVLQKMAMGIETIDTIKKQLPTTTLIMLLQTLVLSHLSYPALLLLSVSTASFNSLERQLNWALKCVFFRSQQTCSEDIRKSKNVISMRKLIDLGCLTYFFQLLKLERPAYQYTSLPTSEFHLNGRTSKIIHHGNSSSAYISSSFIRKVSTKWNSLPVFLRNVQISSQLFKSRLKKYLISESRYELPYYSVNTWRDFRIN